MPTLEKLDEADGIDVSLVVTNLPKPAGRGSKMTPTAVSLEARRRRVPLLESEGVSSGDGFAALTALGADLVVVVAYGRLLPPAVLGLPRLGCINVHLSLLPRWRGAAPVQRAILAGDRVSGVTIMKMDEGLDTGPVLAAVPEPIGSEDDAGSLGGRLARIGASSAVDVVRGLAAARIEPVPQDGSGAVQALKISREERAIDWRSPAEAIGRLVRALSPEPGATTAFRDQPMKILKVRERDAVGLPGLILGVEDAPVIGTGAGAIELMELAPAGRRRMSGKDWAHGAHPRPDERFG